MEKLLALLICCATMGVGAAVDTSTEEQSLPPANPNTTQSAVTASGMETANVTSNDLNTIIGDVRKALNSINFEASFVLVNGKFAEPYNWMHALYKGREIEYLRSQNGVNIEIVRKDSVVGYFEAESQPHSVNSHAIQGVLPTLFFDHNLDLGDYYSVAVGGKSRVLDRAAQLFRIIAKDNYRFDYWLWLDIQTGLILKSALVSKQGDVLEQFQMTHLNVLEAPPKLAEKLDETPLPDPIFQPPNRQVRWKINWLPQGFKVISSNQHKLSLTGEATDYILVTDGLVELSIFIQKPLGNSLKGGSLRSGSNALAVHHASGFDVSVIGKVPTQTAEKIAKSVTSG